MKKSTNFVFSLLMITLVSCASSVPESAVSSQEYLQNEFSKLTERHFTKISISDFGDGFNHARYKYENSIPPWPLYDEDQILGFAENMVYLQNPDGGWTKNIDLQRKYTLKELERQKRRNQDIPPVTYNVLSDKRSSTIDNGNIFSQIKYLCQVYAQVKNKRGIDSKKYLDCAIRAVQWIFNAQHPRSGGFTGADVYAVTYNDDVMSETLSVLKDISRAEKDSIYYVIPEQMRITAGECYRKGLECILKSQIELTLPSGEKILTAWGQQHSHETLKPIWAREFEPPSVCSAESFNILRFLMKEENPTEEIKRAVLAGGEFFSRPEVIIYGRRLKKENIPPVTLGGRTYNTDQFLVDDETAPALWARFYALDSSYDVVSGARKPIQGTYPSVLNPIWCDRGCAYVNDYNDLSQERRNGYGYVTAAGTKFLQEFKQWKTRHL